MYPIAASQLLQTVCDPDLSVRHTGHLTEQINTEELSIAGNKFKLLDFNKIFCLKEDPGWETILS